MAAKGSPFDSEACIQLHDEAAVLYRAVWEGDASAFVRDLERYILGNPLALNAVAGRSFTLRRPARPTVTYSIGPLPSRVCRQVHVALDLDHAEVPSAELELFYGQAIQFLARLLDDGDIRSSPEPPVPCLERPPDHTYTVREDA